MDVTNDAPITSNVTERRLAYMIAAIFGLSLLSIIVDIIALAAGVDTGKEPWTTLWVFPGIALPIGVLLIIILVIVSARRRSRDAREAEKAEAVAAKAAPRVQPTKKKR